MRNQSYWGIMRASMKPDEIDGRAPPDVEHAAQFDSTELLGSICVSVELEEIDVRAPPDVEHAV